MAKNHRIGWENESRMMLLDVSGSMANSRTTSKTSRDVLTWAIRRIPPKF